MKIIKTILKELLVVEILISLILIFLSYLLLSLFTTEIPFPKNYCLEYDGAYCAKYKSKLIHAIINRNEYLSSSEHHNWVMFGVFILSVLLSTIFNHFRLTKWPHNFPGTIGQHVLLQTVIFPLIINLSLDYFVERRDYYNVFMPGFIIRYYDSRVNEELEFCKWLIKEDSERDYFRNDPN